jgi:hypothetical protein
VLSGSSFDTSFNQISDKTGNHAANGLRTNNLSNVVSFNQIQAFKLNFILMSLHQLSIITLNNENFLLWKK